MNTETVKKGAERQSPSNAGLYIVRLEDGVWIAPWGGDPGRTLVRDTAYMFKTKRAAHIAIAEALLFRDFSNPTVEMYNV